MPVAYLFPGLGGYQGAEFLAIEDFGLAGLAVVGEGPGAEAGEQPHAGKRDAGAEAVGGFSDKAAAAGAKDAEDLLHGFAAVADDEEEAGDDDRVYGVDGAGEVECVALEETAVAEAAGVGAMASSAEECFREIEAGHLDLRMLLGEGAGVEAGAAA